LFGRELLQVERPTVEILPGESVTLQEVWDNAPFIDRVTVAVDLTYGEDQSARADKSVWFVPWLILALILLALIGYAVWRRMRSQRPADETDDSTVRRRQVADTSAS
jgi:hypothetical protein